MKRTILLLLGLLLIASLAACGGDDDDEALERGGDDSAQADDEQGKGRGKDKDKGKDEAEGDDDGASAGTTSPGAATTQTTAAPDPSNPACRELSIFLKLDVTDAQRRDIEQMLSGIAEVDDFRLEESSSEQELDAYQVVPDTPENQSKIGMQFDGHPGVVSVVYPNQRQGC